jgi:hypothetical protein
MSNRTAIDGGIIARPQINEATRSTAGAHRAAFADGTFSSEKPSKLGTRLGWPRWPNISVMAGRHGHTASPNAISLWLSKHSVDLGAR